MERTNGSFASLKKGGVIMIDTRIVKIYDIASRMFILGGYSQTQIDHIVKEAGISVGSLYDLFSGKKAILRFIIKCTIDPAFTDHDIKLPITEDLFEDLNDEVKLFLEEKNRQFSEPLTLQAENYSFEQMLTDAFDVIQKYRIGCLLIEKNPSVCGRLFEYYRDYRKRFYGIILEFLKFYMERGVIRKVESLDLAVIFIIESMAWWAMDIRYDTFEPHNISDEIAKKTCLDALINAYKI
jgi:AcrR family transcriptional regulator